MPSTPRCHEMPSAPIHGVLRHELEAGVAAVSNATSSEDAERRRRRRPMSTGRPAATSSGRRRGSSATTSAPSGRQRATSDGEDGKPSVARRPSARRSGARTQASEDAPRRRDAQGVVAHVAGLQPAQAAPAGADERPTPLTAPSMTVAVEHVALRVERPATGPADERGDALVDVPARAQQARLAARPRSTCLCAGRPRTRPRCRRGTAATVDDRERRLGRAGRRRARRPVAERPARASCSRNSVDSVKRQVQSRHRRSTRPASTTSGSGHRPRRLVRRGSTCVASCSSARRSRARRKNTMNTWRLM